MARYIGGIWLHDLLDIAVENTKHSGSSATEVEIMFKHSGYSTTEMEIMFKTKKNVK